MNGTALVYTAVAASANVIGAVAVVSRSRWSVRALDNMVALSAGFMVSVALLDLVPDAIKIHGESAAIVILVGYLLVHLTQHTLAPHFHFGEEVHHVTKLVSFSALAGLILHTFVDAVRWRVESGSRVSGQEGVESSAQFFPGLHVVLPRSTAHWGGMRTGVQHRFQNNRRRAPAVVRLRRSTDLSSLTSVKR